MPIPFPCIGTSFWRADQPRPSNRQLSASHVRPVTPGFFTTLRIPQIAGRDFSDSDTADSTPVAIVSQEVVSRQFADASPLGRRLRIAVNHASGRDDVEWTIVGVVGNMRSTLDGPIQQTIFIPKAQRPGGAITFFVRTGQEPVALAGGVTSIAVGLVVSATITRLLAGLLFEVEPFDATTFAATSLALLTIATVAAGIPALRSMRMAPDALRN